MTKQFKFTINEARARAYKGGRYLDKKNHTLVGVIIRALLKHKTMTDEELVAAVKKSSYKTKPQYVRPDTLYAAKVLADKRVLRRKKA